MIGRALTIAVLAVLALATIADACDCRSMSWQERFGASDLVFVGRVVDVRPLAHVIVDVRETFKGAPPGRLQIPAVESDCDYFLPPVVVTRGSEFLIYATAGDGRVSASRCLGSGPVPQRGDELARLLNPTAACPVPGEPMQWVADFCMAKLSTDDEIAAGSCIAEERRQLPPDACQAKTAVKRDMCALSVARGMRAGSVDQCVADAGFMGRVVRELSGRGR